MQSPRLSFIVPVYKPKQDIFEKHVKSLRDQALQEFEVIFVLDGHDGWARKTIGRIFEGDPRARIIEIPHSGVQAARNKGGELAQGEFLCFFDCDCVLEPGASKMWVEQFDKRPEVGFIYSGYKFFGDKYAIDSEPWDPWTLKIRNYISACFPVRKTLYPGWTEGLKSLQDWDFWLSVVEKAVDSGMDISRVGFFVQGYAFTTAYPDPTSISGDGCKPENWLDRVDAVKKLHGIADKEICVASLQYAHDGIALAKLLDADFQAFPADKPHKYKTIIQVGFSLGPDSEKHAAIFQERAVKKVLFWTGDNINEIYNKVSFKQIDSMAGLLNFVAKQYVEDNRAQRLMERAGFKVEVMPLPLGPAKVSELPKEPRWAVDIAGQYSPAMIVVEKSLPDIPLEVVGPATPITEYTGLIHFFPDRTLSSSAKRALLTGRHVISNIQKPFCGFIDDQRSAESFIEHVVEQVRDLTSKPADQEAAPYYSKSAEELLKEIEKIEAVKS